MDVSLGNALSGLRASETRIAASANNVANSFSTKSVVDGEKVNKPYVPQEVVQSSVEPNGTLASIRPVSTPFIPAYEPENPDAATDGTVQYPNVDYSSEAVNQVQAKISFLANLTTIRASEETTGALLDAVG